jgi:ferric-dicitrate binding protein FerR (iron transport regulator)
MEKDELRNLIRRFLAGSCTPEEKQALERWWSNAQEDDHYLQGLPDTEREALKMEMLRNIRMMIHVREAQEKPETPGRSTVKAAKVRSLGLWAQGWKLAAACMVLALIASVVMVQVYFSGEVIIRTGYGERLEVELPDRSMVVLNGNSSLRYTRWEAGQHRTVWLEGEAFFSVTHTENHNRFTVHTPDSLIIEVLGTQFSVNNRKGATNVILREGEVRLEKASAVYIMKPDEKVSYSQDELKFVTETVDARHEVSWKDNLLIYRDETVGHIIDKLSDSHGIKVIFRNEAIRQEIFNGSVPADSVSLFFDKIERLYGAEVTREEDGTYVIR